MSHLIKRPNILLAISDDQAWPFAGAYHCTFTDTPAFDRIAREGALFTHAFCPAPQCAPSRSALLTGRNIWQLEEAGTHSSLFPKKFRVYTDCLEQIGYHTGYTGKPWGPGNWQEGGRKQNPSGKEYNYHTLTPPTKHISDIDYSKNFEEFLNEKPDDRPFCFWYGGHEPHRKYEAGSGVRSGKRLEDVQVPPFLPDVEEVRSDMLDYAVEIEWFDRHLLHMIHLLEKMGELDHTLIVVTSDNGMPFPRAKANLYEMGSRIPLAFRWGNHIQQGEVYNDFVSLIDIAPTILQSVGIAPLPEMTGKSLLPLLSCTASVHNQEYVVTGRERHVHARADNVGYPIRAIRTPEYLYEQGSVLHRKCSE
jgi:N-sulfoglucosamine sulfohydrolase